MLDSQLPLFKPSRRSFLKYSSVAIASLLAAVGCSKQITQTGNAAEKQPLKVGMNLWAGFMPWQVAKEKDFFRANNLNVELIWFPVLSDQLAAFNAGKIDVAGITLYDFLTGASNGIKSKVISVTDVSLGADAIVTNPNISSLQELAGKRSSIEVGTIGHFLFLKALEKGGVAENKVQIVNQSADTAIASLIANKTDVVYSYEPFVSQAVASGKGKVIFSSKDLPGLVPDLLAVHQSALDRQPEAVQNLLDVWYKTIDYRKTHLEEVLPIEAKQAGIEVEDYRSLLKGFKWLTPAEGMATFQSGKTTQTLNVSAKEVSTFMLKEKLITKEAPAISELIDERFLQKVISA